MLFKAMILNAVETFWALCFNILGKLSGRNPHLWSSPGGLRVLVIAPHPDDEAIGCAGTILRHKGANDTVWIAFVTDGSASRALGLNPDEMRERRKKEGEKSAEILGADHVIWFGLREQEWTPDAFESRLIPVLNQLKPDVIYAPSRVDFHPDHIQAAYALAASMTGLADEMHPDWIRVLQFQTPLTPILTNLITPVADVMEETSTAIKAHESQWSSTARTFRMRRYASCFYGKKGHLEEFWQLTARQYCELHRPPTESPIPLLESPFRCLHHRAFLDPLAYVKGISERKRLAQPLLSSDE